MSLHNSLFVFKEKARSFFSWLQRMLMLLRDKLHDEKAPAKLWLKREKIKTALRLKSFKGRVRHFIRKKKLSIILVVFFILLFWFWTSKHSLILDVANETLSGVLPANMKWSGIIRLAGDVVIPPQFLLNITPGTRIVFLIQDKERFGRGKPANSSDPTATNEYEQSHPSLSARIIADNVTFTSLGGEYADWSELRLFSGSFLENSVVEYSRGGVVVEKNTSVVNSVSRYALWNCFDVQGGRLINSSADHCWRACARVSGNSSVLENNKFQECKTGMIVDSFGRMKFNVVVRSCNGIDAKNETRKKLRLTNNFFKSNMTSREGVFNGKKIYGCP